MKSLIKYFIVFFLFICILSSCKNTNKNHGQISGRISFPDSIIYSSQKFTDFNLDSFSINLFCKSFSVSKSLKKEIINFYSQRDFQYGWFSEHLLTNTALDFYNQLQNFKFDFQDTVFYNKQLDSLIYLYKLDPKEFMCDKNRILKMELLLTYSFFIYADRNYYGTVINPADLNWFIPRRKKNYAALLDSLVSKNKFDLLQEPVNFYYNGLKEKLSAYRLVQREGGWPIIDSDLYEIKSSAEDSSLTKLQRFLFLNGDISVDSTKLSVDSIKSGIMHFQGRLGLNKTGKIDKATRAEMEVPIASRIRQIMVNMERLRWLPDISDSDYLLVNIPEFKLHVFEKGNLIWNSNVVVGKDITQTNIFSGKISQIVLNPDWMIPSSIISKEILPLLKKNPSYLRENNMEVLSGKTVIDAAGIKWKKYSNNIPYKIRQRPGKGNPLGKIKFLVPNNFNIYLHDTPSKIYFSNSKRAFSHGCIRLSEANKLAYYLLRNDTSWTREIIEDKINSGIQYNIKLKHSILVYILYFTAWVNRDGSINFRKDIYGLDERLMEEIFNK